MAIELPGDVVWVLGVLGFQWINLDEDKFRAAGDSYRTLGSQMGDAKARGDKAAQSILEVNKGSAVDAFGQAWEKLSGSHVNDLITACHVFADVLDGAADAIVVAKNIVIAQVLAAAAAFAAATATAIFTLGMSELADLAATAAIKELIREALKQLEHALLEQAKYIAENEVLSVVEGVASSIIDQGLGDALGVSHGFSTSQALDSGWQSGVANAKGLAAAYTNPEFLAQNVAGMAASSVLGAARARTGGGAGGAETGDAGGGEE